MSKSSMRIVLVDPLGDILFSGDSLIAPMLEEDPPTATGTRGSQRSVSGIFPAARTTQAEQDGVDTVREPVATVGAGKGKPPLPLKVTRAA